jgi:hypothetical protein
MRNLVSVAAVALALSACAGSPPPPPTPSPVPEPAHEWRVPAGWQPYHTAHCAPTVRELVQLPALANRSRAVAGYGNLPTLEIRWRSGAEHIALVRVEPGRSCLAAWRPVEIAV